MSLKQKRKITHTFGTSKIETDCYLWLKEFYPNIERQHKDELYPYACDFYIPELKSYIEIQGNWTHGKHPFNKNDINDINIVELWKNKNTNFYIEAIYNWTIRDVVKRETAQKNSLNYLEVFSTNIDECKHIINTYINDLKYE